MSIINKMLQDLEQRSGDGVVGGIAEQVRAVPYEKKSYTAWLLAALLAVLLVGLLAWFWLQPAPAATTSLPIAVPQAALTLKSEPHLNEVPQQIAQQDAVVELAEMAEAPSAPPLHELSLIHI